MAGGGSRTRGRCDSSCLLPLANELRAIVDAEAEVIVRNLDRDGVEIAVGGLGIV